MTFLSALIPVIVIVLLGHLLSRYRIVAEDGWRGIERLCYVLLFPVLIIDVLSTAPFDEAPWRITATLTTAQLAMLLMSFSAWAWPKMDGPSLSSIIQSNVRWNTFIALSLAGGLFGDRGLALTAIAAATMIPLANIISVLALVRYGQNDGPKQNPFLALLKNPLVNACIIGGAINLSGIELPKLVSATMEPLGSAALALGLLAAGAGVDFAALGRSGVRTLVWSLVRLLVMPAIAIGVGSSLGLTGMSLAVVAIATAVPTATNAYVLARQLGGDAPLMANLIAMQTALAAITIPIILLVAGLI